MQRASRAGRARRAARDRRRRRRRRRCHDAPRRSSRTRRALLRRVRRVVVKIGSNVLAGTDGLRRAARPARSPPRSRRWSRGGRAGGASSPRARSRPARRGSAARRAALEWRQAAAAVGQIGAHGAPTSAPSRAHGGTVAQVLLTHDDLADRRRYLNARHTLRTLLGARRRADRQRERHRRRRGAQVRRQRQPLGADRDAGRRRPARHPERRRRPLHRRSARGARRGAGPASRAPTTRASPRPPGRRGRGVGTGGMASKLAAARKAAAAGIPTIIADGARDGVLAAVFDPATEVGTLVLADGDRLGAPQALDRLHAASPRARCTVDDGAERALAQRRPEPAAVGRARGRGHASASATACAASVPTAREFARGLVSYGAGRARRASRARTPARSSACSATRAATR